MESLRAARLRRTSVCLFFSLGDCRSRFLTAAEAEADSGGGRTYSLSVFAASVTHALNINISAVLGSASKAM